MNYFTAMRHILLKLVLVSLILFSCIQNTKNEQPLGLVCQLPSKLHEVSGIVYMDDFIWAIEDSGNESKVFTFDYKGNIKKETFINSIPNIDWEEISKDENLNLYIGDFGNNNNDRKNLSIYQISPPFYDRVTKKITFYYPEQKDFPAKKKEKLYDCEAFFFFNDFFYLFTKNRSKGFDGATLIYKIPAKEGNHVAQLLGSFITCSNYNTCAITGAAISPDTKKIVLLSHDRLWLFEDFINDTFLKAKITELQFHHYSQKEGICFKNNNTLLIADEKNKKIGGNLYEVNLDDLKSAN